MFEKSSKKIIPNIFIQWVFHKDVFFLFLKYQESIFTGPRSKILSQCPALVVSFISLRAAAREMREILESELSQQGFHVFISI